MVDGNDGAPADVVRVICGPTAAGKSALALALAEEYQAVIISADSRQVYRCFDIGTAKPTAEDRARAPHRGIDVAVPTERYSAAAWADAAAGWIVEARRAGRVPLLVGGTGFYLRALFSPLFREPPLDVTHRAKLAARLDAAPTAELRRWCSALDPDRAHLGRTQLLRAVEIALLTGRRLSALHQDSPIPAYSARYLVLDPGARLATRVEHRVHAMMAAGWRDEVRRLMREVPADAPAWRTTGYGTIRQLVVGGMTRESAVGAIVVETRQYAKRQRTWFRHQLAGQVTRIDPADPAAEAMVRRWWDKAEAA